MGAVEERSQQVMNSDKWPQTIYPMNICSFPFLLTSQLVDPINDPSFQTHFSFRDSETALCSLCLFFLPVGVQMTGFLWQFSLCLRARHFGVSQDSSPGIVSFLSSTLCFSNIVYIPFTCWQIPKVYPSDPHFKLQTHINNCLLNSPTLIPWSSQHPCFQNKPNNPTFTWKKPSPF